MILYLDTSTPVCHLWLDDEHFEHQTNRALAKDLLKIILDSVRAKTADLCRPGGYEEGLLAPISGHTAATAPCKDRRARVRATGGKGSEFLPHIALLNITSIAVFQGPGSFTGLRISATVANALADQLNIPIVGATGKNWRATAKKRLKNGENDKIVLPLYGRPANITSPKK